MVDLFEKLRKEWPVIRGAPYSFTIVCIVVILSCAGIFRWYYGGRLSDSETRAANWKGDADYWKEMANRPKFEPQATPMDSAPPPESTGNPPKSATVVPHPERPLPHAEKPTTSISAPNGIAIGGDNKGSATVINTAPKRRHLTEGQKAALGQLADSLPTDMGTKFSIMSSNESDSMEFAKEIDGIFHSRGKSREIRFSLMAGQPGTYLLVPEPNDPNFHTAELIGNGLVKAGIPIKSFEGDNKMKPGEILLFIGPQAAEQ